MNKKYCLHGGEIRSKNDGDIHYIGAARVGDLFGVNWRECQTYIHGDIHITEPGTVCLYPQSSGDYSLAPEKL